jgi:hypothetical protein
MLCEMALESEPRFRSCYIFCISQETLYVAPTPRPRFFRPR